MTENRGNRALRAIANQGWAILPDNLDQIVEIAGRAQQEDIEALSTRLGRPLENTHTVTVRDGVAIIPVNGPLFRYANMFTRLSGATSYEVLATDIQQALDDPVIKAIILEIDSPGGMVAGNSELAEFIYQSRNIKPIVAYASYLTASAAYWIASAAQEIVAADTAVLGSIGTVLSYYKKKDETTGEIVSSQSPKKRVDMETDEGRTEVQQMIDALADVFINTVARNRNVSRETVLEKFGQGGVLVGQHAVDAGLADRIGTLEALIEELSEKSESSKTVNGGIISMTTETQAQNAQPQINLEFLRANHAELVLAIQAEGAEAERARIKGIEENAKLKPGHDDLINEMKFDGKTQPAEAAQRLLQADANLRQATLDNLKSDAPAPVEASKENEVVSMEGMPLEDRCKAEWEKSDKIRAEFSDLENYVAYKKAESNGQVRILSGK